MCPCDRHRVMSDRVIRFYFDYISPNAYLAWTQLPALARTQRLPR